MNILVLDDDENRLILFKKRLIGHSVHCVSTASDTIKELQNNTFDIIFLDHDLGGLTMVTSGEGTGYEVAKWLEENPDKQPAKIIIHSFNPTGSANMKKALPNAIVAPGAWPSITITED